MFDGISRQRQIKNLAKTLGDGIIHRYRGSGQNLKTRQTKQRGADENPEFGGIGRDFLFVDGQHFPAIDQQSDRKHNKGQQVNEQLPRQAQIGERMHRSITQHPTTRHKGRV